MFILHSCKTAVVHKLCHTDCQARLNFLNWDVHWVHDGETDPTLVQYSSEYVTVDVWCALRVQLGLLD